MVSFVEYYMTAFHEGRKGAVGQEALQPRAGRDFPLLLGGTQRQGTAPQDSRLGPRGPGPPPAATGCASWPSRCPTTRPVSGFYCECREKARVRQRPRVDQEQVHGDVHRSVHGGGRLGEACVGCGEGGERALLCEKACTNTAMIIIII